MIEFNQRIWNKEDKYITVFHNSKRETMIAICHPSDPEKIMPKEEDPWLDIKLSPEEIGELILVLEREWKGENNGYKTSNSTI